jgi:hypothetical protein
MNEAITLLLDTHAAIWIAEDQPLASGAVDAVDAAYRANGPIFVGDHRVGNRTARCAQSHGPFDPAGALVSTTALQFRGYD